MQDPIGGRLAPARRTAALVALAGALLGSGCATGGRVTKRDAVEKAEKYYAVALASYQTGMFEDSKVQISHALTAVPDHPNSHYLRGLIYLNDGKGILDTLDQEICLRDEAADRQRVRADALHRDAHASFATAAEAYNEASSGRGRAYNSMAVVSLHFGELPTATEEAQEALKSEFYSERYSAYANLGWAYYEAGDLVSAITELRSSIMVNPDYCVGRYRLARAYLDVEMYEQALEEIQRVVGDARCPIQDAHRVEGVAARGLGRGADARSSFETCMSVAPRSCLARDCKELL